jgi:tellurium resistance protein TerD
LAKQLVKGEKVVISKINDSMNHLTLNFTYQNTQKISSDVDIFLFMFEESSRISKKGVIFYNNPESICKSVRLSEFYEDSVKRDTYEVDLNKLPSNISKLILACSIYKSEKASDKPTFANITLNIANQISKADMFSIDIQSDIIANNAVILGEIYKHNDSWKFNAVESTSNEGLLALLRTIYNAYFY